MTEQEQIFAEIVENNDNSLSEITTGLMTFKGQEPEKIIVLLSKEGEEIILTKENLESLIQALEID